jgi:hypothetical protein
MTDLSTFWSRLLGNRRRAPRATLGCTAFWWHDIVPVVSYRAVIV